MDLNRTPSQIANAAADQVRQLNHRTLDPKAFTQPGDVSDVADSVATLLERLPEALAQMQAGLCALEEHDAIRLDDVPPGSVSARDVSDRVAIVQSALGDAREDLSRAHATLKRATGPLSHMGGPWEDDEA
jgi:hypothetical protein